MNLSSWSIRNPVPALMVFVLLTFGGLLAFTFALDNVIISDFVRGEGANTFPTYVFGLARTVMKPDVAAMATLLLGITLAALVGAVLILRRSGDDSSKIAATLTGS